MRVVNDGWVRVGSSHKDMQQGQHEAGAAGARHGGHLSHFRGGRRQWNSRRRFGLQLGSLHVGAVAECRMASTWLTQLVGWPACSGSGALGIWNGILQRGAVSGTVSEGPMCVAVMLPTTTATQHLTTNRRNVTQSLETDCRVEQKSRPSCNN